MVDLHELPTDLPVPQDDGAADHLVGLPAPRLGLPSTEGKTVALDALGEGRTILYLYPLTGLPDVDVPVGWDEIPGARGCTPEACAFRDHHQDLLDAGAARVLGLSSQDTDYQRELVDRLHLPFPMLSDPSFTLGKALDLPTFEAHGTTLYKRLTLVILDGVVEHVFYPVFPPDEHAQQVVSWLHSRRTSAARRDVWLTAQWPFVLEHLPPAPASVLEIGCGTAGGFVPRLLEAGYDALGVDPMAPAGPHYTQLEFERLAVPGQVDAVVACTSLHHVADLDELLTAAVAAMRPGGTLVVVEMDWERFDEATARWCFDRLRPVQDGAEHVWLHHMHDEWIASGEPWADYLRAWTSEEGLHTGESMARALDARFERQSLTRGPYFFADLEDTSESAEQAAIDGGVIQAAGLRYVGRLASQSAEVGRAGPVDQVEEAVG